MDDRISSIVTKYMKNKRKRIYQPVDIDAEVKKFNYEYLKKKYINKLFDDHYVEIDDAEYICDIVDKFPFCTIMIDVLTNRVLFVSPKCKVIVDMKQDELIGKQLIMIGEKYEDLDDVLHIFRTKLNDVRIDIIFRRYEASNVVIGLFIPIMDNVYD